MTQITLGAAVGEALLGRQLGNRALLLGAAFGTLPDLDVVLTPFLDPVQFIVHHRGLSHSLVGVAVASPLLAWLFARRNGANVGYGRWLQFFLWVFLTHILLDCCTSYGTQILLPFSDSRVAWSSIFIIDPLYTLPLVGGVVACLFCRPAGRWRRAINGVGLVLSTAYLALTIGTSVHVEHMFAGALERQDIPTRRLRVCPTPLNSVLWYGIAEDERGYHAGFYSLLDAGHEITFQFIPRREELLGSLANTPGIDRLRWFADDYFCVRPHPGGVVFHVLKFGSLSLGGPRELFPFSYVIREDSWASWGIIVGRYQPPQRPQVGSLIRELWTRLKGVTGEA